MSEFTVISVAAPKVPVEIREQFSFDSQLSGHFTNLIKDTLDITEVMVLSTCNRCEIYYTGNVESSEVMRFWCSFLGAKKDSYKKHFEIYRNEEAIRHLFQVSVGIKSQVIGDQQIINQIKSAYNLSVDHNAAGPYLHRLMHTVFYNNKSVANKTHFQKGSASASYSTKLLVDEITRRQNDAKILILGAGQIGEEVVKNLVKANYTDLTIVNRTMSKSLELARQYGLKVYPFEEYLDAVNHSDVVISSVSADRQILLKEQVEALPKKNNRSFIDLSVPRSIASNLTEVKGTRLYTIDQIQNRVDQTLESRLSCLSKVNEIIEENVEGFQQWARGLDFLPIIGQFKSSLEMIRNTEMKRFLKKIPESDMVHEIVNQVSKAMINKIVKLPTINLKNACTREDKENMADVLRDLFELEINSSEVSK